MAGRRRFKSITDCRRYLGNILNRVEGGELSEGKAKTLAYIVSILVSSIEKGDLEKRLERLEAGYEHTKKS